MPRAAAATSVRGGGLGSTRYYGLGQCVEGEGCEGERSPIQRFWWSSHTMTLFGG